MPGCYGRWEIQIWNGYNEVLLGINLQKRKKTHQCRPIFPPFFFVIFICISRPPLSLYFLSSSSVHTHIASLLQSAASSTYSKSVVWKDYPSARHLHRPVQLAALYSTPRDELLATARHAHASRAAFIWELWTESIGIVMFPENKISNLAKGILLSWGGVS